MTYSEKLKHPKWQKKRLDILERDGWACKSCGDTETTLHIHHHQYNKGASPWEYDNDLLVTYCEDCHAVVEDIIKRDEKVNSIVSKKIIVTGEMVLVISFVNNSSVHFSLPLQYIDSGLFFMINTFIEESLTNHLNKILPKP